MKKKLTRTAVTEAKAKDKDYIITDTELKGFGLKVTPKGRKVFIFQYRIRGEKKTHRITIGPYLDYIYQNGKSQKLTVNVARSLAEILRGKVRSGINPKLEKSTSPETPIIEAILDEFIQTHVKRKLKARTASEYIANIEKSIKPSLASKCVNDISRRHIEKIHSGYSETPFKANHILAVLSKFFNWCEANGYRDENTNPCKHVKKYKTKGRERFLSTEENDRLNNVLNHAQQNQTESEHALAAIGLLRATGARRNEILTLRWEWVDLDTGVINLPDSKTGQKQIFLNTIAIEILNNITKHQDNPFVIVGKVQGKHLVNIQPQWSRLRSLANLSDVRIHDLRHTFASVAASNNVPLHMIGSLLGHKQHATTFRYAHLTNNDKKIAAEKVGLHLNF